MRPVACFDSRLIKAFQNEDEEALNAFMSSDYYYFDCNMEDSSGNSFLMYACSYGLTEIVKKLIQMPSLSVVNKYSFYKSNPLIEACRYGSVEIVKLLLTRKEININANYNNSDIGSALSVSCRNGNTKIVKELIKQKSLIYDKKSFLYAADYSHKDIVIMLWPYYKNVYSINTHKIINEHIIFVGELLETLLPIDLVRLIIKHSFY